MNQRKKRILLINTQMEKGGAQKALLTLASNLDPEKFEVFVATMYDKEDFISFYENLYGLKIINLKMKAVGAGKLKNGWLFFKGLFKIHSLLRKNRIEIVQTYSHYPNILVPIIAYFAGVKNRITSQRMSLDRLSGLIQKLDKLVANSFFVSRVVSVSEGTKDSCVKQGISEKKIIVIPNGLDLVKMEEHKNKEGSDVRKEFKIADDHLILSCIARLHNQKGHKYLLPALVNVLKEYNRLTVLLVGEGELREEINEFIEREGLNNNVVLLGSRDDVPRILSQSDIFILPSLWEGMPNSVLEAMASELPVIATSVDGTPEIISNDQVGILIQPESVEEIEHVLIKLTKDKELRKALGKQAKEHIIKNFSLESSISKYEDLYYSL